MALQLAHYRVCRHTQNGNFCYGWNSLMQGYEDKSSESPRDLLWCLLEYWKVWLMLSWLNEDRDEKTVWDRFRISLGFRSFQFNLWSVDDASLPRWSHRNGSFLFDRIQPMGQSYGRSISIGKRIRSVPGDPFFFFSFFRKLSGLDYFEWLVIIINSNIEMRWVAKASIVICFVCTS